MIESSSNLRQCAQNPTGDQKACNRMYISCLYEPVGHALIFKAVSKHRFNLNRTCMQGTAKSKLIKEAKKKKSIAQMRQHSKNLLLGYITSLI